MNLLINTSNLYVGGGVQVALSFIDELKTLDSNSEFHIIFSPVIEKYVDIKLYPKNFHFYTVERSPASLRTRKEINNILNEIETEAEADLVFTIFGPSYWTPKAEHLLGIADGWVYNPESVAYTRLNVVKRLKMRLHCKYKRFYFKRDADYYVVETNDAKKKLAKTVGIDENRVTVVGNTYSSIFNDAQYVDKNSAYYVKLPVKGKGEFRLIYIAHNHANKNLVVINDVIPLLEDLNIKFILTLDDVSFKNLFPNPIDSVINIGPVALKSCPSIYSQCDALFAPTLLETFSASYPEAMKMEKPILTSGYSFAIDTCQDAALYFNPLDPTNIASSIRRLIVDTETQSSLIAKGKIRLNEFETASSRAVKYIKLCESIVSNN